MRTKYDCKCPYCEKIFLRGKMGYANHLKAKHPFVVDSVGEGEPVPGNDAVSHPSHYTFGRFEVIEVLEDWFPADPLLWQVGKYISRAGRKDSLVTDLEKAKWYLERRIAKAKEAK